MGSVSGMSRFHLFRVVRFFMFFSFLFCILRPMKFLVSRVSLKVQLLLLFCLTTSDNLGAIAPNVSRFVDASCIRSRLFSELRSFLNSCIRELIETRLAMPRSLSVAIEYTLYVAPANKLSSRRCNPTLKLTAVSCFQSLAQSSILIAFLFNKKRKNKGN